MKQVEGDRFLSSRAASHFVFSISPILIFPFLQTFPSNFTFPIPLMCLFHFHTLSWFLDCLKNLVIGYFVFKLFKFWTRLFTVDWNYWICADNKDQIWICRTLFNNIVTDFFWDGFPYTKAHHNHYHNYDQHHRHNQGGVASNLFAWATAFIATNTICHAETQLLLQIIIAAVSTWSSW